MTNAFVILTAVFALSSAWGGESTLVHSQGTVEFKPDTGFAKTGKDGQAIVSLPDGSRFKMKPETELTVESGAEGVVLKLERGGVLSQVRKQIGAKRFVIRTKSVVMGVRGTEFFASSSKKGDVWMCVHEGAVEITSEGKSVEVPAGKGVRVAKGGAPSEPKAFEWTKDINWNFDPSKGAISDKINPEKIYPDLRRVNYD